MRRSLPWLLLLLATTASAQDAFEIQVYAAETADPGMVGAETHFNHFFEGSTVANGVEFPTKNVTHLTLEPHVGLASWCDAGAYISTAFRADGTFDYAGIKLRFKMRWPTRLLGGLLGLALNQELSATRPEYEADQFGWELRPIIDLSWRRLYVSVNPILDMPLRGTQAGTPDFEPSIKSLVRVLPFMGVGAEYYAGLGPVTGLSPLAQQSHRLFGALDFEWRSGRQEYEVNVAVGYDFTGTEKWIAKLIFAIDLEPRADGPAVQPLPAGAGPT